MAKRSKTLRTLFTEGNDRDYLEFCEAIGLPYTLTHTNYTLRITSSFCNAYFMQREMSKKAFIAGAKIKKDISKTGLVPPEFDKNNLGYFAFANNDILSKHEGLVFNVDIKSAYANVLFNHALITNTTYNYMCKLSKEDRLACVGMLASRKDIYEVQGRETFGKRVEINKHANWFYFCVNRVSEIMDDCRKILGKDFLFFWVDGIFFTDFHKVKEIAKHLNSIGYKFSVDICSNLKFDNSNDINQLTYYKLGNDHDEYKQLFLPKRNNKIDEMLINFLLLKKQNHHTNEQDTESY